MRAETDKTDKTDMRKKKQTMAHIQTIDGIRYSRGAISKKREQGINHFTNTRVKEFKDPITGEGVAHGPNEMYLQSYRDYDEHPLTEGEQKQRSKWREACKAAAVIIKDKSHPRYMELYHRWREQLSDEKPCMQFPNFVRAVLASE